MRQFLKRVLNTVSRYDLWKAGDRFIIGVSGGADSLCLLDVLFLLSEKYGFSLHIAHVNYGLRGKDSEKDEAVVRSRATLYNLPLTVLRPKVKAKGNLEETLRDTRYAFFETLRKKKDFDLIVVAHNEDDQAETLLLRLLRGSGLSGLSAMEPKTGRIIRPLIEANRLDILRYTKERKLTYRVDKTNTDTHFLRNRIRHELLPLLEKKYQPQIKKLLARTATLLAGDYALLKKKRASDLFQAIPGGFIASGKKLTALPLPLLRQELRVFLSPLLEGKNPSQGLVIEIIKALKSNKNKAQTLSFRGLKLVRKGDTVTLLYGSSNDSF